MIARLRRRYGSIFTTRHIAAMLAAGAKPEESTMGDGSSHADRDVGAAIAREIARKPGRLELMPDEALTNVATYPAAYRIAAAHEGGYFVTIESAGPPRLFGQVVFAGDLAACTAYLARKLAPPAKGDDDGRA